MNAQLNLHQSVDVKDLANMLKITSLESFLNIGELLKGKNIVFTPNDRTRVPINGWKKEYQDNNFPLRAIAIVSNPTIVTGIDSSCIKIAETEEGTIYAIKCGIVFCISFEIVLHFKIGPLLLYLTEASLSDSELDSRLVKIVSFDSDVARRMIRINTERLIQFELAKILHDSVILVDGILKVSPFENRNYNLKRIIENCVLHNNSIVGIGKSTKFKILDTVSGNLRKLNGPGVLDVSLIVKSLVRNVLGFNTLVKFAENTLMLRADIVEKDIYDVANSLGKILGNDPIPSGYPECLSLAHHISCFSNTEIAGIRGHILRNYDVVELASQDVRTNLLGSI
ncbi:MAG TPA: hypothetical protein VF884_03480 [Nitrososphaeraceae archaeon]